MTIFSGMLSLHIVAALGIFSALSLEALMLFHLRRAGSARESRVWIDLVPGLPAIFGGSAVVVLLTGAYLTARTATWPQAWLKIAIGALVLMAPFGAVSGRRMRTIRSLSASEHGNQAELIRKLQDPVLKFSLSVRMALVLGIVLLMTAKPELRESLGIFASSLLLGFAWTALFWRDAPSPAMRAPFGE
jgi:hypothetical protein